jgi:hypothetical protein
MSKEYSKEKQESAMLAIREAQEELQTALHAAASVGISARIEVVTRHGIGVVMAPLLAIEMGLPNGSN